MRADIGVSGYVIRPYEGDTQAHVTFVLHVDPKFVLPTFVVNAAVKEQALNVARLREVPDPQIPGLSGAHSPGSN